MRIGIAVNDLTLDKKTGVERYVERLVAEMMMFPLVEGDSVLFYVSHLPSTSYNLPAGWTWRVLSFPFPKGWTHLRLSYELWRNPPDVFFNPSHEIPCFVSRKTKVISTVHDVAFRKVRGLYSAKNVARQEWAIARVIKKASILLAISEATKQDLVSLFHVPESRIVVTSLGVDAAHFAVADRARDEVLQRYRLAHGRYVLFVGRLEEKKNVVTLIRAFAELRKGLGVGHPLELVLAGRWGFGEERIKNVLKAAGEGIRVVGFVPDADLPSLYAGALCFCFPSMEEGFGLPVLEAAAAGVPVIASDIPALREAAGDTAVFVSPQDTAAWTSALRDMVFGTNEREIMIEKGKSHALKATWHDTAQKTWDVIHRHSVTFNVTE